MSSVKAGDTGFEKRQEKIHERRKGKDMFEVCDNFRKEYFKTMFIIFGIASVLLPIILILKFNELDFIDIPFWWAFIISAAVLGISLLIEGKTDLTFITILHLKKEIRQKGFEELCVNTDFMMATYHDLTRGILAIGQSYYVVFTQKYCRVGEINSISKVTRFSNSYKINGQTMYKHFICIIEKDNTRVTLPCRDEISATLITQQFRLAGIETEKEEIVKKK